MPQANFDYKFNFRIEGSTEVVASFDAIIGLLDEVKTKTVEIRDTSTDAFGRLIKNSYREQDAIRGTIDLFKAQYQVMKNLQTQNDAIIEGARRRGALTAQEETLLRKNIAQIDEFSDSILVSTTRMDRNSESFVQANVLYRDFQRSARNAENAIDRLSNETVTATHAQEYFNDAMQAFKSDGQIIVNQMRILAREMDAGKISTQAGLQVWSMYENQLEDVTEELRKFIQVEDLSADEMARATSILANLTDAAGNAQRGFAGTRGTMLGMSKVTSGANQILLSFGDIIQDSAQFSFGFAQGARAIGNNIAFAAEQFLILRANLAASQGASVTFGAAMKSIVGALKGPFGAIILINTLVTAVTMFSSWSSKAAKDADTFASKIRDLAKSNRDLIESLKESNEYLSDDSIAILAQVESLKQAQTSQESYIKTLENANVQTVFGISKQQALKIARAALKGITDELSKAENELTTQRLQDPVLRGIISDAEGELSESKKTMIDITSKAIDIISKYNSTTDKSAEALNELMTTGYSLLPFFEQSGELTKEQVIVGRQLRDVLYEMGDAFVTFNDFASKPTVPQILRDIIIPVEEVKNEFLTLSQIIQKIDEQTQELFESWAEENSIKRALDSITLSMLASKNSFQAVSFELEMQKQSLIDLATQYPALKSQIDQIINSLTEYSKRQEVAIGADAISGISKAAGQFGEIFGASKEFRIAMATVDAIAAVISTFATVPFPANIAVAAGLAASLAAQIKSMQSTEIGTGGSEKVSGASGGSGGTKFGFQMSQIQGPQTFRTPGYMPENQQRNMQPKVDVKVMANRKQLYAMVKTGEEEYRQVKV